MIHAICFDLFHTLVDVGQAPGIPGRYTADILGLDREAWNAACFSDAHDICRPTDHREVVRKMAHSLNPAIPVDLIRQAADERKARFDYTLRHVDPQVIEVLRALRDRGLKLALVSNASTGEVDSWPVSPLAALFDAAVFSCKCGHAKPDALIYEHALQQLGSEAGRTLFVGDGGSNEHAGAAQAGLIPVMLTRFIRERYPEHKLTERARHVQARIHELAELHELLDRFNATE
ncbi:MAG: HAD family hydrolase [Granulosicoccaceae bacterium]|jgi:putative hydrolase of the HAD superfamily